MYPHYRTSDFLHIVQTNDSMAGLYNSLTSGVLFVTHEIAECLKNAIGGIFTTNDLPLNQQQTETLIEELEKRRLVFPLGKRHDLEDYQHIGDLLTQQGISIMYLMLADGCNLGCKYCYIERHAERTRHVKLMTQEVADAALDKFAQVVSSDVIEPQVILYGGEPLLNKPVLFHVIERVDEMKRSNTLPEKLGITINTNGTLIDDEFAERIAGRDIQISISLDGPEDIHNAMRPYLGGSGSYHSVVESCKTLKRHGVDFGFSVTINGKNLPVLEDVLLWIHREFAACSIGFNVLVDREPELLGMSEDAYGQMITEKLISCFKICRKLGIYEDRMMRKVDAFIRGYPYLYDCGAPGDQLVVTPDALVGVCQGYCANGDYFVPLKELRHPKDHEIWKMWRFRSPLYQKQCYDCIALGICGGGCPYSANVKHGSIWGLDEVFCTHAKATVEFLIQDLFKQIQRRKQ